MTNIRQTINYDLFELSEINRNLGRTSALEKSMSDYGWIDAYPMHVVKNGSGKLKIKAGHHRFHVAKKLGIPCKYVITEDKGETIQELEVATNQWSLRDYLDSYCRLRNNHYIKVREYAEWTGIPLHCCVSILGGNTGPTGNLDKKFKAGTFKVSGDNHAECVGHVVLGCVGSGVKFAKHRLFVSAISLALRLQDFDKKIFISKVATYPGMLTQQATLAGYLDLIEQVYNYHSGKNSRLPVAFLAKQEAQNRNAVNAARKTKL